MWRRGEIVGASRGCRFDLVVISVLCDNAVHIPTPQLESTMTGYWPTDSDALQLWACQKVTAVHLYVYDCLCLWLTVSLPSDHDQPGHGPQHLYLQV